MKVGISPVSEDNARANIAAELPSWDFRGTVAKANEAWNNELGKIVITTDDDAARRTFYTAMYHSDVRSLGVQRC